MNSFQNGSATLDSVSTKGSGMTRAADPVHDMYPLSFLSSKEVAVMDCGGSRTAEKLKKAVIAATAGGALGALVGASFVSAVCACGGMFFGPQGTFFGFIAGKESGAAVGGFLGIVVGSAASLICDH